MVKSYAKHVRAYKLPVETLSLNWSPVTFGPLYSYRVGISEDEFVCGSGWAYPTNWPLEFKLKVLGAYSWLPFAIQLKQGLRSLLGTRS